MRIQIFCFSLLLMITGIVYAAAAPIETPKAEVKKEESKAAPEDFSSLGEQPDNVLAEIASHLSDADLARFQLVSRKFRVIGQAEFETRANYLWKHGEIIPNQFHAHEGSVEAVFVSNNGNIISVGADSRIYVWKWDGEKYKKIGSIIDDVNSLMWDTQFSRAENRLVIRHRNNIINVWDVQAGKKINQFEAAGNAIYISVLSPDGMTLAIVRLGIGDIEFWDVVKGAMIKQITSEMTPYHGEIWSLAFSTDGKKLASSSQKSEPVCIWDVETLALENQLAFSQEFVKLLFLPGNKLIAYKSKTEPIERGVNGVTVSVWDVETNKLMAELGLENPTVTYLQDLAFSHDGALVAEGVTGNILPVWYIKTKKIVTVRRLNTKNQIYPLTFSPDDKMLVAGCENGDIVTWKAQPKKKEAKSTK